MRSFAESDADYDDDFRCLKGAIDARRRDTRTPRRAPPFDASKERLMLLLTPLAIDYEDFLSMPQRSD